MQAISPILDRVRYSARSLARRYPAYLMFARVKYRNVPERVVDPTTELVIDGFERSGQSFAVEAFRLVQHRDVRLAHHLHAPAQIAAAVWLGVPALVLVRRPEDAVVSQLVRRQDGVTIKQALRSWAAFHRTVLAIRPLPCIATFEEVTSDFGAVIDRVNHRYGTGFERFQHTAENVERCFKAIETTNRARWGELKETVISRPSSARSELRLALLKEMHTRANAHAGRVAELTHQRVLSTIRITEDWAHAAAS